MLKTKNTKRFWRCTASTALLLLGATCLVYAGKDLLPVSVWAGELPKPGDHILTAEYECLCFASVPVQDMETLSTLLQEAKAQALEAYHAYERSHPEVFWLSPKIKLRYLWKSEGRKKHVLVCLTLWDRSGFSARVPEFADGHDVEKTQEMLDWRADCLLQLLSHGSRAETVRAIHGWLTHNNEYNTSPVLEALGSLPHSPLPALVGRSGEEGPVCGGYAKAFQLLCLRAGIPARQEWGTCVCPVTGEKSYHMWNSVQLEDGRWYGVDVCWDDPTILPHPGAVSGRESEDWLLVTADQLVCGMRFADSHPADPVPGRLWTQEQRRQNDDLMARFAEMAKDAACPF